MILMVLMVLLVITLGFASVIITSMENVAINAGKVSTIFQFVKVGNKFSFNVQK